jgi:hypothetical protein
MSDAVPESKVEPKIKHLATVLFAGYALAFAVLAVFSYRFSSFFNAPGIVFSAPLLGASAAVVLLWTLVVLFLSSRWAPPWKSSPILLCLGAFSALAALVAYPFQSADSFYYITVASTAARYGISPYKFNLVADLLTHPGDSMLRLATVNYTGANSFPYGYAFYGYIQTLWHISFGNPAVMLYLHKGFMLAIALGCGFLASKIDEALAAESGRSPLGLRWWIILISLNPVVLMEGVANGHNDLMLLFLFLGTFLLIAKKHPAWAMLVFILAFQWKITALFLAPFLLIWALRRVKPRWHVALYALGAGISFLPYWFIFGLRDLSTWTGISKVIALGSLLQQFLILVLAMLGSTAIKPFLIAWTSITGWLWWVALGALAISYIVRKRNTLRELMLWCGAAYLLYVAIFTPYLQPWYLLWLLAFIPLFAGKYQKIAVLMLSFTYAALLFTGYVAGVVAH